MSTHAYQVGCSSASQTREGKGSAKRRLALSSLRGSALLAALCFGTVLTISLGSYMTLCTRTLTLSSRSAQGTLSLELAETGLEDALWALNKNDWSAWTIAGSTATRTITGFNFGGGVTGRVEVSVTSYDGSAGARTITARGVTTAVAGSSTTRTLTSACSEVPVFVNAVAATTSSVAFASGGTVDSYDSSLGSYSSQTPGYSAIVASQAPAGSTPTIQLTNAVVKGYAASNYATGPSYSTSGKLIGPTTPDTTRIDPSRISASPFQPVIPIRAISGGGTVLANPAAGTTVTLGSPTDTVPAIYYSSGLNLTSTTKITVNGPVRLVVTGAFYIGLNGGTPSIDVTTNGTLEVFAAGDIAIYGNGINNVTNDPKRVVIYGTNTLTAPDMNTAVPLHGVIYTPYGQFNVLGNSTIYGALIAKKVVFSGSAPTVHYDLNLRRLTFSGLETIYGVSNWRESFGD